MNLIIVILPAIAAVAAVITGMKLSARLIVVVWHGPGDHPRQAPRVSPADVARLRAGLASRAHQAGSAR